MDACIGMSTTLHGVMRGLIEDTDLDGAAFIFSCGRGHVLGTDLTPCEATALNISRPVVIQGRCRLLDVDPAFRPSVVCFVRAVERAEREGRVTWLAGNQAAAIANLPKGTRVFWRKGWTVR